MPKRSPNPNLIRTHWTYTYDEAARALGVHKNTIARWVSVEGLPAFTDVKPFLISGGRLKAFLTARRERNKAPCGPGEVYCFSCRAPRTPAEGMTDYIAIDLSHGNLVAICRVCENIMRRMIRKADLDAFQASVLQQTSATGEAYGVPRGPV